MLVSRFLVGFFIVFGLSTTVQALICQNGGSITDANGVAIPMEIPLNFTSEACLDNESGITYACNRIDATATVMGFSVLISYGQCLPKIACNTMTCDSLASFAPAELPINYTSCCAGCCETNNCNKETAITFNSQCNAGAPTGPPSTVPTMQKALTKTTSTLLSQTTSGCVAETKLWIIYPQLLAFVLAIYLNSHSE